MKLKLHHLNLCTTNVPAMDEFYRSVLDMAPEPSMNALRVTNQGYGGDVAFVTDGTTQVHLAEKDLEVGFRTGKAINPWSVATSPFAPTTSTPSSGASTRREFPMPTMAALR